MTASLGCACLWVTVAFAQQPITLPIGTPVKLVTLDALSSKTSAKGDLVRLQTSADVMVNGVVAIPAGTAATGQIADARAKGAMGMSGKLLIRPLFLRAGSTTVRLSGQALERASVSAGAVIGTVATALPVFTGRSAVVPAGSPVAGVVERTVTLSVASSSAP
jgi:hypothetical protein